MRVLWIAISLALIAVVDIANSQSPSRKSDSLVLRGKVLHVRDQTLSKASVVALTADLRLEYVNTGIEPVILLTERAPGCVGTTLTKSPGVAVGDNVLFDDYRGPSVDTSTEWEVLRNRLDREKPPVGLVQIIEPGEHWTTNSFVVLRPPIKFKRYRVDRPPISWSALRDSSPVWLRLNCDVWPNNVEVDPLSERIELGHKLQNRWRRFGHLQLRNLISEPMELDLRKSTQSEPNQPLQEK
jgi:hypothetical protein